MTQVNVSSSASSGIGVFGLTFVVLLVMKLANIGAVGSWSWWWVTAPLWGPLFGVFVVWVILVLVLVIRNYIK